MSVQHVTPREVEMGLVGMYVYVCVYLHEESNNLN